VAAQSEHVRIPAAGTRWPAEAVDAVGELAARIEDLRRENDQLRVALATRVTIEQAKGVLAERHLLAPEQAFEALRRAARDNRRPLRDLAEEVLHSNRTPPDILRQLEKGRR
jgi:AmiR/NasT family two-component response regulator